MTVQRGRATDGLSLDPSRALALLRQLDLHGAEFAAVDRERGRAQRPGRGATDSHPGPAPIRASTRWRNTSPGSRVSQAQRPVGALDRVDQVTHPERRDRQRPPRPRRIQPQVKLKLPGRQPASAATFSASTSWSSGAEPRCSMFRDPRRDDHTIWTAVAPEAVFTVRT
jgi:hypothetical protein